LGSFGPPTSGDTDAPSIIITIGSVGALSLSQLVKENTAKHKIKVKNLFVIIK
jgi:UDP-N-acetylglucosamine:LPS N-acetylglucosamine transferase